MVLLLLVLFSVSFADDILFFFLSLLDDIPCLELRSLPPLFNEPDYDRFLFSDILEPNPPPVKYLSKLLPFEVLAII